MSAAIDPQTGVVFESVMFRNQFIEVSFTEEADRGDGVARVQTIVVDAARRIPAEHQAFIAALTDLVDAAGVALRNPPDELRRGG